LTVNHSFFPEQGERMKRWEEKEVKFFGKITAGFTHELKNVLAIIRESSGLMEDIISISPEAIILYQDKIQKSLDRIKNQIIRGVELTDRLNRFAHSTDENIAKIDLPEFIEQFIALSQRFARLKNVALITVPAEQPDQSITIVSRLIQLQMALYTGVECCLNTMPAGGEIRIGLKQSKEKVAVQVLCKGDLPEESEFIHNISASEKWQDLQEISAGLGGSVEVDESAHGIVLFLPDEIGP